MQDIMHDLCVAHTPLTVLWHVTASSRNLGNLVKESRTRKLRMLESEVCT
jgi:hypothetical protein